MSDHESRKHLHVGGQAVIEGVMMRSPTRIATAVRNPAGKIVVRAIDYTGLTKRHRVLNLPIIRGAIVLVETFVIALKALSFSAHIAGEEDKKGEKKKEKDPSAFYTAITFIAALVLGFFLFFYIPLLLTEWIGITNGVLFNIVDGAFRLAMIVLYIYVITRWKEMQRIFEYHGAEHKTIFAFEDKGEFQLETVQGYPRVHPRCSTSFILLVVIVSILLFIILGRPTNVGERLIRFAFIPLIGGISYELLRLSTKPAFRRWFGFIFWPGLFMQRLTTREPSPDQIEVAITALNACLSEQLQEP
jgi:uncharacterized protein YqhQ